MKGLINNSIMLQLAIVLITICHICTAAPTDHLRVKRDDELSLADDNQISPIASEDTYADDVSREKRKSEVFSGKNAILGYVFGKIDNFIDAKTHFIDNLDKQNIAKNKQHNIEVPKPIGDFRTLVQAVVSPKISAITSKIGGLSGVFGGSSGSSSGGGHSDGGEEGGSSGGSAGGIGGILSSFLKLSGPILSSSSQSATGHGGGASVSASASIDTDSSTDEETPY